MGSIRGSRRAALQAAAGHDNDNGGAMTLTMDVLDRLHAADPNAATELVQDSADAVALIELLEMLWNCGIPRAPQLLEPVLQRLLQLRPTD